MVTISDHGTASALGHRADAPTTAQAIQNVAQRLLAEGRRADLPVRLANLSFEFIGAIPTLADAARISNKALSDALKPQEARARAVAIRRARGHGAAGRQGASTTRATWRCEEPPHQLIRRGRMKRRKPRPRRDRVPTPPFRKPASEPVLAGLLRFLRPDRPRAPAQHNRMHRHALQV